MNLAQSLSFRLANHVRTSTLAAGAVGPLVSFSFDDAPASAAAIGAPILEDHGVRGTFYLNGELLGQQGDYLPLLDRAQAARLARMGHEIGCHTFSHSDVRRHSWRSLSAGIDKNAASLAEFSVGGAPRSFAYPFGGISLTAKLRLQSRFDTCRGIYSGLNSGKIDLGHLRAVSLASDTLSLGEVRRWIAHAVAEKGWLIFFTHDVGDHPTVCGVTPDYLNQCVAAAVAAGCRCLPVTDAADRIRTTTRLGYGDGVSARVRRVRYRRDRWAPAVPGP